MNRLKQLREQNGLSQIELGNRLGVTQQSVFAWEHDKTSPQIQTAIALSKLYGVSLDYLFGLSDDPQAKKTAYTDELLKQTSNRVPYTEDISISFSEHIASIRNSLNISQDKFGELLNVSQRTVAYWESGERMPSYETIALIADKFDVSIDYLLGRSDNSKQTRKLIYTDELKETILNRINALPEPILPILLDLMDVLLKYQGSG